MQHGLNDPSQVVAFAWSAILLLSMPFALVALIGFQVFYGVAPDVFERTRERLIPFSAAFLSVMAGAIHLALTPEHAQEVPMWGTFFALVGIAQVMSGVAILLRPYRWLYVASAFGNVLLAAIYIMTRIIPPPLSPSGAPEEVEIVGIFTVSVEVALGVALIQLMRLRWYRASGILLVVFAGLSVVWWSTLTS